MSTLLLGLLLTLAGEGPSRLYVLGTSMDLRAEACEEAPVLGQVPFGTECAALGDAQGEWRKVRCGEAEGHALAALLGPRKPSLQKLKADARNPRRTLEQREESALRAALMAPEDAALRKELGSLFFTRNLDAVSSLKALPMRRPFTLSCATTDARRCLQDTSRYDLAVLASRAETTKDAFVVALDGGETFIVYRGRFRFDTKTRELKGEVLEQTHAPLAPVWKQALFSGHELPEFGGYARPAPGRFSLDAASLARFSGIPDTWAQLKLDTDDGIPRTLWDPCAERPNVLVFQQDIHGRVRVVITGPSGLNQQAWVSSVAAHDNRLELDLVSVAGGDARREVFKLPEGGGDIAYLGATPYTRKLKYYPSVDPGPCREGGP
jgi:hypothetical protein